jgi:hypothetical protein
MTSPRHTLLGMAAVLGLGMFALATKPAAAVPPSQAPAWGWRRNHSSYSRTARRQTSYSRRYNGRYDRRNVGRYRRYGNDIDGDGIPNNRDRDIDGDGIPNYRDNRPNGSGFDYSRSRYRRHRR